MSHPTPKFKLGQRVRIVGCVSRPEANGRIVTLVDGPRWFEGGPAEAPDGTLRDIPAAWTYRTDIGTHPDWALEYLLEPHRDADRPVTWGEIEIDTGWRPELIHA